MQGKGTDPQNMDIGATGISRAGYERLYEVSMEERKKLGDLYQKDMVSAISSLYTYVGMELKESRKGQDIFQRLTEAVGAGGHVTETQDRILCLVIEYGAESEENGFRRGFRTAMKLCMDSMGGGVCR